MEPSLQVSPEGMRATICTILSAQTEFVEINSRQMEGILVSVEQWAEVLYEELSIEIQGMKTLVEAMWQEFSAELAVAEPPVRLQVVRVDILMGTQLPGAKCHRTGKPICQQCGGIGHLRRDCPQGCPEGDHPGRS